MMTKPRRMRAVPLYASLKLVLIYSSDEAHHAGTLSYQVVCHHGTASTPLLCLSGPRLSWLLAGPGAFRTETRKYRRRADIPATKPKKGNLAAGLFA
jgi:hypothetical protein